MKKYENVIKIVLLSIILLTFSSCGYRPSAEYTRIYVGDKISTNITISSQDPENTVLIKDAVDSAVLEIFNASITSKDKSQTHLQLSIASIAYTPIQYNTQGYEIAYRATTSLNIVRTSAGVSKGYVTKGSYDFSVNPNAVITDQERFDAIKISAVKAIKSFISQLSAEGARSNKGY